MANKSVLYEMMINLDNQSWGVSCPTNQNLIGPVQYGWDRYRSDHNSMTFGGGLMAGSPVPGTRRMIICGYSPCWDGFYTSALGGAMYIFHRIGVNFLWLRGRSRREVIIVINFQNGEYTVEFHPVNAAKVWDGYTDGFSIRREGFYALQSYIFDHFKDRFQEDKFRILTVGPGAKLTNFGAIGSNQIRKGMISTIDDWAGRGGLGSRLFQYHRVAGIIFGGDWQDPALKQAVELDQYFLEHFGQRAIQADLALSQKYRYVPKFDTGGTFGVNMHTIEDKLFSHNYQSVNQPSEKRFQQQQNYIQEHYLKQFNDEIIEPRNFDHCGEPCAVACKKFFGEFKKDYEPYEALGPNIGVFDQRAAENINKLVDTYGLDSIQTGGYLAWFLELFSKNLLPPEDFNLPIFNGTFEFSYDKKLDELIAESKYNSEYASLILKMILFSPAGKPFRKGMQAAARWMKRHYGIDARNLAVYNAHGKGCMVPNQYWTPGMFSPMPIMGKYFSFYENKFLPPYELGKKNVERFVYELYSENSGSCRFHRKWVEDIIDEIILSHFELKFDFWQTNFALAKAIHDHQSASSKPWESRRVLEIIHGFLLNWRDAGLQSAELDKWLLLFEKDQAKAGRAFWKEMFRGMSDAFEQGMIEPVHAEHGFIQK